MTRIAVDTSCLVAALCTWHARHPDTLTRLTAAVNNGDTLILPAHCLAEAYSVLTRLPAPHRLSPIAALDLLGQNLPQFDLVALSAGEYWLALSSSAGLGIAGGTVYDALIAAAAQTGGANILLTLNERHMHRVAGDLLSVESPVTP